MDQAIKVDQAEGDRRRRRKGLNLPTDAVKNSISRSCYTIYRTNKCVKNLRLYLYKKQTSHSNFEISKDKRTFISGRK